MAEQSSQDSSSFLIRLWREPREDGDSGPVRCYVRNLKTGEELYPEDPTRFVRLLAQGEAEVQSSAVELETSEPEAGPSSDVG